MTFTFVHPVKIEDVVLMDMEETDYITTTTEDGQVTAFPYYGEGDNSVQSVPIDVENVVNLEVGFPGSGAVGGLNLCFACADV